MSLICTGTISIDTVTTPEHGQQAEILGGSCTYFAAAASFFGPVRIVAAVGEDFPAEMHDTIAHFAGIDTRGLEVRRGSKTFRWGGKYHDNMDNRDTTFTDLNVLAEAPPVVPAEFLGSRFVFLANSHPGVQAQMLASFERPALVVADTMDLWINVANPELRQLLGSVHGLVLNYDEAEQLTKTRNPVTAGRHILDMGPRFVVIKKGEHGAILVHRDGISAIPAYPTELVMDPTGAGDTFAGGMMGHIAATAQHNPALDPGAFETIRDALGYATITASYTVEAFSLGRLKNLRRIELDARYREFAAMVRLA